MKKLKKYSGIFYDDEIIIKVVVPGGIISLSGISAELWRTLDFVSSIDEILLKYQNKYKKRIILKILKKMKDHELLYVINDDFEDSNHGGKINA